MKSMKYVMIGLVAGILLITASISVAKDISLTFVQFEGGAGKKLGFKVVRGDSKSGAQEVKFDHPYTIKSGVSEIQVWEWDQPKYKVNLKLNDFSFSAIKMYGDGSYNLRVTLFKKDKKSPRWHACVTAIKIKDGSQAQVDCRENTIPSSTKKKLQEAFAL